jgi:GcrA cell cycle regulator
MLLPSNPPKWSPDERAAVLEMLLRGETPDAVAVRFGISRDAASGRISRDPLLRDHRITLKDFRRERLRREARKRPPAGPQPELDAALSARLRPLVELGPRQCRWPVLERAEVMGGYLFCSAACAPGAVYCREHAARARGQPGSWIPAGHGARQPVHD